MTTNNQRPTKMTKSEFADLLTQKGWTHTSDCQTLPIIDKHVKFSAFSYANLDFSGSVKLPVHSTSRSVTSLVSIFDEDSDIRILHNMLDEITGCCNDSHRVFTDRGMFMAPHYTDTNEKISVVDEWDRVLTDQQLINMLPDCFKVDPKAFDESKVTDVMEYDYNASSEQTEVVCRSTYNHDLRFNGELVGLVNSQDFSYKERLVGANDIKLTLYKTNNSSYVCCREQLASIDKPSVSEFQVVENLQQVVYFYGQNELAKLLYVAANIDNSDIIADGYDEKLHGKEFLLMTCSGDNTPDLSFHGKWLDGLEFANNSGVFENVNLYGLPNGQFVCWRMIDGKHVIEVSRHAINLEGVLFFFKDLQYDNEAKSLYSSLAACCAAHVDSVKEDLPW